MPLTTPSTLPRELIDHPAFLRLSAHAKALLIDLGAQYRGDNNGDLGCAWKLMKPRGWRSEATLHKAKQELLHAVRELCGHREAS